MAIISNLSLTFADWAKRVDDDGKIADIIELLSETNPILLDMRCVEGNLTTGHKTVVRTGIPAGTWRTMYSGVQPTKSTTATIVDTCGNLEAFAEVDKDVADLNGDTARFRLSESMAFMEGMNQQMAQTIFYGSQAINPERFTGFAPRFKTVQPALAQSAANVIDAGGTGSNNASIWIVTWGERTCMGIFPKGKLTGLRHEDISTGKDLHYNPDGSMYRVYRDHYKWEIGLTVKDWRYIIRIANIDVPSLQTGTAANLINLLIRGFHRLPTTASSMSNVQDSDASSVRGAMGQTVIYCNRDISTYLDLQALNKTNVLLQMMQFQGMVVNSFRGVPIRTCDALLSTEARVV